MTIRVILGLGAWFLSAAALSAQPVQQWKFTVGAVYEGERVVTHKQSVELLGKAYPSQRRSAWSVRLEVIEKNAKSACLLATLVKVEHRITPVDEWFDPKLGESMQGGSFKLTVTPTGQLTKFDGYEDFLRRLAKDDKGKFKALNAALPQSALREACADLFGPLPDKALGKTETWQRDYVEPIPHFGSLRSTMTYKYGGAKDSHDQFPYSVRTKYEAPNDDMSVLFRVTKGNIASEKAAGLIVFDNAAGHLVRHDRKMLLRGSVTIETMDRQKSMEFVSENEMTIRIKAIR